jgi:hypothetical protein
MKTFCAAVVGMLLMHSSACHAQGHAFPIKLTRGTVTLDQSDITTSVAFGKKWVVGAGNRLVLIVDEESHILQLVSVDANNQLIMPLAESTRAAFLANGAFAGILEFTDLTVSNGLFAVTGDGAIEIRGRVRNDSDGNPVNVSGQLVGVLNDSTIEGNANVQDALIKATIESAGGPFDATDLESASP